MELLEREQSLDELGHWLTAVRRAGGCTVLLAGEAGIGKTALLQEFARRQSQLRVLWGACDALFTPRPLAPLHDIARQTQGQLSAALRSGASPELLFTLTLDELERQETLLIVEDVHWADEATLDLIKYLGRRISGTRAMLAVSYRDDELGVRHPLRLVIGELPRGSTHRMALTPLSEAAVTKLARQAGRPTLDLHRITAGNPFFVSEVLAGEGDRVPPTVRDAVLARAAKLSPAARRLAELVCLVPGRTEQWVFERIARPDEAAIDDCLSIGMVRHADGSIAFRHELARRALEDCLSQPRRQEMHAQLLKALATRPDVPAARLAHHAAGANDRLNVLHYAPLAGKEAASVGAHREAAAHYRSAVAHAGALAPAERATLLDQLTYECFLTGDYVQALPAQRAALEIWRLQGQPLKVGESLRWLSRLSWFVGDSAGASRYCAESVATLESLPPSPELAMAYCERSDLALEAHEAQLAIESAQAAISLAQRWGKTEILCDSLTTLGTMRLIVGDSSGRSDLDRCLQLALANNLHEQVASAYTNLLAMAVSRREYPEAAQCLQAGLRYCAERDLDFCLPYILAYSARMKFEQGEWIGASEDIEAVLRHPHTTAVTRIPALRTLAHLRVRRGDPDVSTPVQEARSLAGPTPELQRAGMMALVCAEEAWLADNPQGVVREIQPVYELAIERRDPRMLGELAVWLWRVGALTHPPRDIPQAYACEMAGDWRSAARAWQSCGCPYEQASVLGWYGGEAEQREALTILERLGAAPAARALRRRMRLRGMRQIPRGSRESTRRNEFGLTRREAEILALLAQGLRNAAIAKRLFLSTKTVEHHISAILAKLKVRSRAEAVSLMHQNAER